MNDLTRLCKEMKRCGIRKNYHTEEIVCTRAKVQDYVGNDRNKFLKLKALVRAYDDKGKDFALVLLALQILTFMASAFSIVYGGNSIACFMLFCMIVLSILYSYNVVSNIMKQITYDWVKYIEVVLEEINISDLQ